MVSMRFDAYGPRKESGRSTNISYRGLLSFAYILVGIGIVIVVFVGIDQSGGSNVSGSCSVTG